MYTWPVAGSTTCIGQGRRYCIMCTVPRVSVRAEGTASRVPYLLHVQLQTATYSYSLIHSRSIYDNSGFCILVLDAVWFGRKLQTLPHLQDRKLRPLSCISLKVLLVGRCILTVLPTGCADSCVFGRCILTVLPTGCADSCVFGRCILTVLPTGCADSCVFGRCILTVLPTGCADSCAFGRCILTVLPTGCADSCAFGRCILTVLPTGCADSCVCVCATDCSLPSPCCCTVCSNTRSSHRPRCQLL